MGVVILMADGMRPMGRDPSAGFQRIDKPAYIR